MCLCNRAPLPCSVAHVFPLWSNHNQSFCCKKMCSWLCTLVVFVGSAVATCWWEHCGGNEQNWHLFSLKENCSSGEWHYKLLVHVSTEMNNFIPPHNPPFRDLSQLPNHLDCQFATWDLQLHDIDVTSNNVLVRSILHEQKGGTGVLVHPKDETSIVVSGLSCRNALVTLYRMDGHFSPL